jgi:hypothetical protein
VPAHLRGFRTLFSSFHHFKPGEASEILSDAAARREGIGIFEFTQRSPLAFLRMLLSPLWLLLTAFLIKPFHWRRVCWTYLIPVMPLMALWDGVVSNLRTYSCGELDELSRGLGGDGYTWESGILTSTAGVRITYLIGCPQAPA